MEQQQVINEGVRKDIEFIKKDLAEINFKLDRKYVTHDEFTPVRNIVYGMVASILLTVLSALIYLVIQQ